MNIELANDLLLTSATNGDAEALRKALSAGADLNCKDSDGRTAVMLAVSRGQSKCLALLIQASADLETKYSVSMDLTATALMMAVAYGKVECLSLLIAAKVNLDATDSEGWTVSMFAAAAGKVECLSRLIQAGANLDVENSEGQTAFKLGNAKCRELIISAKHLKLDQPSTIADRLAKRRVGSSNELLAGPAKAVVGSRSPS